MRRCAFARLCVGSARSDALLSAVWTSRGASRTRELSYHAAGPQNKDSAMCYLGGIGPNFVLSEYTLLWYLSLAPRQRGVWQDPAPEDANNILAHWNKKSRKLTLQEEPSWYSPHCGHIGNTFRATPQGHHTSAQGLCNGLLGSSGSLAEAEGTYKTAA